MYRICVCRLQEENFTHYIELKVGKNKATQKQKEWIKRLTEQGNMALVCYGWEEASAVLLKYIRLKSNEEL